MESNLQEKIENLCTEVLELKQAVRELASLFKPGTHAMFTPDSVTVKEAAILLNVSTRTIHRYICAGIIDAYKNTVGPTRILTSSLNNI